MIASSTLSLPPSSFPPASCQLDSPPRRRTYQSLEQGAHELASLEAALQDARRERDEAMGARDIAVRQANAAIDEGQMYALARPRCTGPREALCPQPALVHVDETIALVP